LLQLNPAHNIAKEQTYGIRKSGDTTGSSLSRLTYTADRSLRDSFATANETPQNENGITPAVSE
jgi:hypothetical protein